MPARAADPPALTEDERYKRRKRARVAIEKALRATWDDWRPDRGEMEGPDFAVASDVAMDALGDLAGEILADGTMLRSLDVRDGVATLELEPATEILKIFVASMRGVLDGYGAENYVETEMTAPSIAMDLRDGDNPLDSYTVTIQRRTNPTPHEFRQRAERRAEAAEQRLAAVLAECDRIVADVHGQHDEDDDGMREAVRRIRTADEEVPHA